MKVNDEETEVLLVEHILEIALGGDFWLVTNEARVIMVLRVGKA